MLNAKICYEMALFNQFKFLSSTEIRILSERNHKTFRTGACLSLNLWPPKDKYNVLNNTMFLDNGVKMLRRLSLGKKTKFFILSIPPPKAQIQFILFRREGICHPWNRQERCTLVYKAEQDFVDWKHNCLFVQCY